LRDAAVRRHATAIAATAGDRPQLVIGLLCAADGCPVAVEVFEGNTADPAAVAPGFKKP
jgi:transposase